MHVFFDPNGKNILPKGESHHAIHVLRLNIGDSIIVLDGKGALISAKLKSANSKGCEYEEINKQDPILKIREEHISIINTLSCEKALAKIVEWMPLE